jgi:ferredoxin-type protein NapH
MSPLSGRALLALSIVSRSSVIALLCCLALWTEYLNFKVGYNSARLVELSSGTAWKLFYEFSDSFFSLFGDPLEMAARTAGMTWSVRLLGIPFTDPVSLLSVLVVDRTPALGFALGALIPIVLAVTLGRVFCGYVCPASLLFFAIGRLRRLLGGVFLFPNLRLPRGFAWGILAGGLILVSILGHGVWTVVLPYFAMGQTIFHSIAFGTLSVSIASLALFAVLDLFIGFQFTCRYVCPTGRFLGFLGSRAAVSVRRDRERCLEQCTACAEVCPFEVNPKLDETRDCSMCGACMAICPTNCLTVGRVA